MKAKTPKTPKTPKAQRATTTPHQCRCIVLHVTDPAHRAAIVRQIEVERMGRQSKSTRAMIGILTEQLRPCPHAGGAR